MDQDTFGIQPRIAGIIVAEQWYRCRGTPVFSARNIQKNIFYKIYVSYRKDSSGKKTPTLRFVYKFLDSTNDDILQAQGSDSNLHIFTSLYAYKTDEENNETLIDEAEKTTVS